ncbi:hypothetical protein DFJ73DRAFT_932526 [Zopfochytrium polystomum]|nr:hypothetical protein DFJ73DRAFT_932526 [Zopfochytrium polystomum]
MATAAAAAHAASSSSSSSGSSSSSTTATATGTSYAAAASSTTSTTSTSTKSGFSSAYSCCGCSSSCSCSCSCSRSITSSSRWSAPSSCSRCGTLEATKAALRTRSAALDAECAATKRELDKMARLLAKERSSALRLCSGQSLLFPTGARDAAAASTSSPTLSSAGTPEAAASAAARAADGVVTALNHPQRGVPPSGRPSRRPRDLKINCNVRAMAADSGGGSLLQQQQQQKLSPDAKAAALLFPEVTCEAAAVARSVDQSEELGFEPPTRRSRSATRVAAVDFIKSEVDGIDRLIASVQSLGMARAVLSPFGSGSTSPSITKTPVLAATHRASFHSSSTRSPRRLRPLTIPRSLAGAAGVPGTASPQLSSPTAFPSPPSDDGKWSEAKPAAHVGYVGRFRHPHRRSSLKTDGAGGQVKPGLRAEGLSAVREFS